MDLRGFLLEGKIQKTFSQRWRLGTPLPSSCGFGLIRCCPHLTHHRLADALLQGLQIGSDPHLRSELPPDHGHPFETLIMPHAAGANRWQLLRKLARVIDATIPSATAQNGLFTPYEHADISKPETQRRFYDALTKRPLLTQIPLLPKDTSIFLPSWLRPLTSNTLHNLPPRTAGTLASDLKGILHAPHPTQRRSNYGSPSILHQTANGICGAILDNHGDHDASGCRRLPRTVLLPDAIAHTLATTWRPFLTLTDWTPTH
jgi:hypothetical protein